LIFWENAMTAIPTWLRGNHTSVCSITPQSVASDGTLSDGATSSLVGSIDGISINTTAELEEISPMTTTRHNNVIIKSGTSLSLTEILKSNGTNILAAASSVADVFRVNITRGPQSWAFYGVRSTYTEDLQKGKSVGVLTLEMVDINSANPTYA
jgi:hypothetical protein